MKRLPVIMAVVAVLALLTFVLRPGRQAAPVPPTSGASAVNPACLTARNVTDTYQPEPNRADALAARRIAGDDRPPAFIYPLLRRQYAQAFALLQKIDEDGTVALTALPASTPDIDNVINRHLGNLVWARSMLGAFYEQGRAGRPDPVQAAAFFQKAIDTNFSDDRGCVHSVPITDSIRKHYVAVLVYDMISVENHAKAMSLLEQGGPQFASARFLLSKNHLPMLRFDFFTANLDQMAEDERNPPPEPAFDLSSTFTNDDAILGLLGRTLLWCAVVVTLFVGGVGLFRYIRRKQGYKDDTSLYRTVFAVYDLLHGVVARFGLVAQGLIGCFVGLSILAGGFAYGGNGKGTDFIVLVTGVSSFLGGLAKFVEAARVSSAPGNSLVHGAARPAGETEAHAAARGDAKTPDLHNRTFKE